MKNKKIVWLALAGVVFHVLACVLNCANPVEWEAEPPIIRAISILRLLGWACCGITAIVARQEKTLETKAFIPGRILLCIGLALNFLCELNVFGYSNGYWNVTGWIAIGAAAIAFAVALITERFESSKACWIALPGALVHLFLCCLWYLPFNCQLLAPSSDDEAAFRVLIQRFQTIGLCGWLILGVALIVFLKTENRRREPVPSENGYTKIGNLTLNRLLSFRGRARRLEYWHVILLCTLVNILTFGVAGIVTWLPTWAVTVRRFHDVNESGRHLIWMHVLSIVAVVFSMGLANPKIGAVGTILSLVILAIFIYFCWCGIVLGFCRGTKGKNRFGGDPFGDSDDEAHCDESESIAERKVNGAPVKKKNWEEALREQSNARMLERMRQKQFAKKKVIHKIPSENPQS